MASQKDYRAIAEAIKNTPMDGVTREKLVSEISWRMLDDNIRFKPDLFREACQPKPDPITLESEY